jgi:hypothetical protein
MPGAGASSTFWRRLPERSRSNSAILAVAMAVANTWISMWRGRCAYLSTNTASSKILIAPLAESSAAKSSSVHRPCPCHHRLRWL